MGIRIAVHRLTRPKCVGMFISNDTLYTHKSVTDPDLMLQQTQEERRAFLRPVPHDLTGLRAKFEVYKGAPTAAVGVAVGPVLPIIPVGAKKTFLITVVMPDGTQLYGWSRKGNQALRFVKTVNKLAIKAR